MYLYTHILLFANKFYDSEYASTLCDELPVVNNLLLAMSKASEQQQLINWVMNQKYIYVKKCKNKRPSIVELFIEII